MEEFLLGTYVPGFSLQHCKSRMAVAERVGGGAKKYNLTGTLGGKQETKQNGFLGEVLQTWKLEKESGHTLAGNGGAIRVSLIYIIKHSCSNLSPLPVGPSTYSALGSPSVFTCPLYPRPDYGRI